MIYISKYITYVIMMQIALYIVINATFNKAGFYNTNKSIYLCITSLPVFRSKSIVCNFENSGK